MLRASVLTARPRMRSLPLGKVGSVGRLGALLLDGCRGISTLAGQRPWITMFGESVQSTPPGPMPTSGRQIAFDSSGAFVRPMPWRRRLHPDVGLDLEVRAIVDAADLDRDQAWITVGLREDMDAAIATE